MIEQGLEHARRLGAAPVVVIPSGVEPPSGAVVIIDDLSVADVASDATPEGAEQRTLSRSGAETVIVFPGCVGALNAAVVQGRLPRTSTAFVLVNGRWQQLQRVQPIDPVARAGRRRARDHAARILKPIVSRTGLPDDKLGENLHIRRLQPLIDGRADAVLGTLLAPGDFPHRMTYFIERRVLVGVSGLYCGGAERQVLNTIDGLRKRGIDDVHLLVEQLDPGEANAFYLEKARAVAGSILRPVEQRDGLHPWILAHPRFRHVLTDYLVELVLARAATIMQVAPEIVHTSLDWTNIATGLAAVLAGVPRVVISGRNLGPRHFEFFQWFMYPCYRAMAAHPSVHFVNNSEAGRDDYAAWLGLPKAKISVVRNGLHTDEFRPVDDASRTRARKELGLAADAKVVVGAFRLSREKRPLLWIDTAARIRARFPDAIFLLCGTGNMKADVEARAQKLSFDDSLRMLGARSDIQTIFAAADIVMQTSLWEGTPNTLIEAQAMGVPVVTTTAFGAVEAVEHGVTGIVVPRARAANLAAAAIAVLADAAFAMQARDAGPRFIERRFGMRRMIDETLAVYTDAGAGWSKEMLPMDLRHKLVIDLRSAQFNREDGQAWVAHLPEITALADSASKPWRSPLVVLENGTPLGPAHTSHGVIRKEGSGTFSHWGEYLWFSSSDNSDISSNGRRYLAVVPRW